MSNNEEKVEEKPVVVPESHDHDESKAASTSAVEPNQRDVLLCEGGAAAKMNMLLLDLVRLHRILWKLQEKENPTSAEDFGDIADRIVKLFKEGKPYDLAGLKDVPKPFMKSTGRFLTNDGGNTWRELDDADAKREISKMIFEEFNHDDLGDLTEAPYKDWKTFLLRKPSVEAGDGSPGAPIVHDIKDVILFYSNRPESPGEKMYEQQLGNRAVFNMASQYVSSYTNTPEKRVEAAMLIMKGVDENQVLEDADEPEPTSVPPPVSLIAHARYLSLRPDSYDSVKWDPLDAVAAAEFTLVFVFEVFLEKEINFGSGYGVFGADLVENANLPDTSKPSKEPIHEPTDHDVLFGRGGMTNSHPGNRRFRDVIALHRPDYIRAIKMDKPAVARKIVRAIRMGTPPGRFLRKDDDGFWYDVGDRAAAEKTSQGLRERSNAEKRQRSALREALKIRKQDMEEDENGEAQGEGGGEEGEASVKKPKLSDPSGMSELGATVGQTLNYVGTNLAVPLSLNMKEQPTNTVKKKADAKDNKNGDGEILNTEGLPPNAVDEEGNILVTDYDILCGRGGLTNHHKGNKRFRDVVALHRPDYVRAPKIQKPSVARVIVRAIRNGDPPGRFLKKDEKTGKWYDIGDKRAAEKTSQALREKTNEERDKIKRETGSLVILPSPSAYLAPLTGTPTISVPAPVVVTVLKGDTAEGGMEGQLQAGVALAAELKVETSESMIEEISGENADDMPVVKKEQDDKDDGPTPDGTSGDLPPGVSGDDLIMESV